mmetsp:Transcript_21099/g.66285  ORF Transcript_21099/g.66285 Transcript_21099/m.66285 type:complete len:275 (+) Transcript_21099:238-1062(+)
MTPRLTNFPKGAAPTAAAQASSARTRTWTRCASSSNGWRPSPLSREYWPSSSMTPRPATGKRTSDASASPSSQHQGPMAMTSKISAEAAASPWMPRRAASASPSATILSSSKRRVARRNPFSLESRAAADGIDASSVPAHAPTHSSFGCPRSCSSVEISPRQTKSVARQSCSLACPVRLRLRAIDSGRRARGRRSSRSASSGEAAARRGGRERREFWRRVAATRASASVAPACARVSVDDPQATFGPRGAGAARKLGHRPLVQSSSRSPTDTQR